MIAPTVSEGDAQKDGARRIVVQVATEVARSSTGERRRSGGRGLATRDRGRDHHVPGLVDFVKGPRSLLTNPAILAGAAGIMAQIAMQQTMDEITDYLATINEKVDDVLRAQKDAVLARVIGAGFVIEESMAIREKRGRVDEVTWSKVQATPATIAETQAYALRQLDALAEKMERKTNIGDLAETATKAESTVREWLAVLARCFQLQDAIAVLELDRVLDASPEELDGHRLGLRTARQHRLEHISRSTERLVARMNAAAGTANAKVLLHPTKSPAVVQSSNHVATGVYDFHGRLGIESGHQPSEARRWVEAATEARDKALETGAKGIDAARSLGNETLDRASSVKVQAFQRDRRASAPSARGRGRARRGWLSARRPSATFSARRHPQLRRAASAGGGHGDPRRCGGMLTHPDLTARRRHDAPICCSELAFDDSHARAREPQRGVAA